MLKRISICGIACDECPAYASNMADDSEKKERLAAEWSNDTVKLSPDEICCSGCSQCDWKMTAACGIRKCCLEKGYDSCAYCAGYPCERYKERSKNLDLISEACQLAVSSNIAYLSSVDENGYPNTRAMLNMEVNGLKTIWFSTNTPSPKIGQFMKNSKACVCYSDNNTYKGLTLAGDIEILQDDESKRRLWREGFEIYYPGGVTDPGYSVLKLNVKWAAYFHNGLLEFFV